jgi:hypothetical protein
VELIHGFVGHLFVEVAGGDDEDGFERLEPAFLAGGKVGLESDLETGPGVGGNHLAATGVMTEDDTIVQGGAGIILALFGFEFEHKFFPTDEKSQRILTASTYAEGFGGKGERERRD